MKKRKSILVIILSLVFIAFNLFSTIQVNAESVVLKNPTYHARVIDLKKDLKELGFIVPNTNFTNYYGPSTETTIKRFQKYYGLKVSGIVDNQVFSEIDKILSTPLKRGKRHEQTIQLKKDLKKLGYAVPGKGTNLYGSETEKRVKQFQKDHQLVVNGIVDPITQSTLAKLLSSVLEIGDRKQAVVKLKQDLAKLGFPVPGNSTTYFGPKTEEAVKKFQSYYGMKTTGIADDETLFTINKIISSPLQKGKRHQDTVKLKQDLAFLVMPVPGNGTPLYGIQTETKVRAFQKKHNLVVNGIADPKTLEKIEELLNEPMSKGVNRQDVVKLKEDLKRLGFAVPGNGTPLFGTQTEIKVRDFQLYYGLKTTGIADKETLSTINKIVTSPLQKGKRHEDTVKLKQDLAFLIMPVPGNGTTLFGSQTEAKVMEFQKKYDLVVNGIADPKTLEKIKALVTQPMSKGVNRQDVVKLKKDLKQLGFAVPGNGTPLFGTQTELKVKEFQKENGLPVSGIADEITLKKIDELLKEQSKAKEITTYTNYNLTLNQALDIQMNKSPQTDKYRNEPAYVSAEYIKLVGTGVIDGSRVNLRTRPEFGDNVKCTVGNGTPVKFIDEVVGADHQGSNKWYKIEPICGSVKKVNLSGAVEHQIEVEEDVESEKAVEELETEETMENEDNGIIEEDVEVEENVETRENTETIEKLEVEEDSESETIKEADNNLMTVKQTAKVQTMSTDKYLYVHSSLVSGKSGEVTASSLYVRADTNANSHDYGQLKKGARVSIRSEINGWYEIQYQAWRNATREDTRPYLDPSNNNRFQHLLLSSSVGVSASELNKVLKGQGVLNGLGQAFINGAKKHKVNEIYLISHAFLETGRGTSKLATGVKVGKNKSGKLVLVTDSNRKNLTDIKTTYNMFGIGAVDSNALAGGATRAYQEGWTTPEKAIEGGAKFIGERYIHNNYKQNTLYKMRWNPAKPGTHQYATDIGWAVKQIKMIEELYEELTNPTLHFDIPVYK